MNTVSFWTQRDDSDTLISDLRRCRVPMPAQRNQRLILLEFNELCPHLVDRFIDEGVLPITSGHPSRSAPKSSFAETLPLTDVRGKLEQTLAYQA
jgi:hypothetical protein